MEEIILEDLRSFGKSISNKDFKKSIDGGAKSVKYTQLVESITKEIQILSGLEEHVNAISLETDSSSFLLEVSSFLKETGCLYNALTTGQVENRLDSNENKLLLLDYLIGELRASRIINANTPNKKNNMQVTLIENNSSKCLKDILMTLKFPKPPQDITTSSLFNKINTKLQEIIKTVSPALIGKSLVCNLYSNEQWVTINNIVELLNEEFNIRRSMLLTRLDVTVQSFQWPDRLKNKKKDLENIYSTKLDFIKKLPNFSMADFLLAREDLTIFEKTSSTLALQNTNSSVNKVIIGQVPDRGGRPSEQQAPPPEMPSWQQRSQTQGSRGSQSNRGGQFNSREGQGRGQPNRDDQFFRNPNSGANQGANVYQMTDGFQSINVGNENRNSYQNNRRGRVQGGWNNSQPMDYQSRNYREQSGNNYYHQGNQQNTTYDTNRFQSSSNERQWNNSPQNLYGSNQDQYHSGNRGGYGQNNSETNKRGYSKRGRGHDGWTYYNQQRNNQNY